MTLCAVNLLASYAIMGMKNVASRLCNGLHGPYLVFLVLHSRFNHHFLHSQMMVNAVSRHKIFKPFTKVKGKKFKNMDSLFRQLYK